MNKSIIFPKLHKLSNALSRIVSVRCVTFKRGIIRNAFKITPCLQISYNGYGIWDGFAIELHWLNLGVGVRFFNAR